MSVFIKNFVQKWIIKIELKKNKISLIEGKIFQKKIKR